MDSDELIELSTKISSDLHNLISKHGEENKSVGVLILFEIMRQLSEKNLDHIISEASEEDLKKIQYLRNILITHSDFKQEDL